ncbi:MAG: DNA cytosine methyltransferase [Paraburkholderia sp.]|uniref:DNA cytosine methyltransferase n=1 Tax=Paraburkholderia sp. TaxID=1926495 RepID=UPI0012230BB6|nr:DNA cytosine methyltransferase [Paraburkholderia sp.]TAL92094.1 MAG: DNA cytosine methyltransferase [Paraburkholderia sp.]
MQSDAVLSLFSGAGGFSSGFASAGLKPVCGAEIDADACSTYEANVDSPCHALDLSTVSASFFKDILGSREPLAIIGGPPCQGFSTAGARNPSDPRNRLIFNYLRIVEEVRPRWFIFENVEGLLTAGQGDAVFSLVGEFLRIGYSVRVHKVNFASYGVPQTRKRVLIIGNRLGADFVFPDETHSFESGKSRKKTANPLAPSLTQAIAGLGDPAGDIAGRTAYSSSAPHSDYDHLMRSGNETGSVSLHYSVTDSGDLEKFSHLRPGQTMKDLPEHLWHDSFRRRAFRRVQDGTPTERRGGAPSGIKRLRAHLNSLTITGAATREFIHPSEHRTLTLRECARLQSFPDRYEFTGNAASVAQQVGNAVPPLAARVLAHHIQHLDGQFGSGLQPSAISSQQRARLFGFVLTEASGMSPALQRTESLLFSLQQRDLFA